MAVKIVRLVSGEEILCNYREEDGFSYLKNPTVLIPMDGGKLALVPWIPYSDKPNETVTLETKNVMFTLPPLVDLMNEYNKTIGTGLVVPSGPVGSDIPNLKISD